MIKEQMRYRTLQTQSMLHGAVSLVLNKGQCVERNGLNVWKV